MLKNKLFWEGFGFVTASSYRKIILSKLKKSPKTPKNLSKETNLPISHISKTLKELKEKKIVECLSPSLRKGKIYALTNIGEEIAKGL